MERAHILDDGIEWNLSTGICINIKKSILVSTQHPNTACPEAGRWVRF